MKKLFLFLLSTSILAHGQAFRWSTTAQTVNSSSPQPGALLPALNIPNATIAVCTYPANGVPCTNYATTYTDPSGTTTCPSAAQLTGNNSAICIAKSDVQGNAGAWLKAGNFQYTMTTLYGSFGPYDVTVGGGGGVAGTVSGQTPTCLPKASGASALTAASAVCDSGATITSTEPIVAPSLSTPNLTVAACTTGQAPLGDGSGACFTPSGGGTVNAGQLALAQYPTSTGSTLNPANFTYDAATGNVLTVPTLVSSVGPVINAMAFGAKGDNSTDNLTAFNSWLAAIAATPNSTGLLPPGTYKVNGSTTLTNAVNATIQAYGATIVETAPVGGGIHKQLVTISGGTNTGWYGGSFIGNDDYTGASQGLTPSANIAMVNTVGGGIFDTFQSHAGYAAIFSSGSTKQTIRGNYIQGEGSTYYFGGGGLIPPAANYNFGILLLDTASCTLAQFPGNSITDNFIELTGTGINGGDCNDGLIIARNHISRTIAQHAVYVDGLMNGHVTQNTIIDVVFNGIKVNPPINGVGNIDVSDNIITTETAGMGIGAAILVSSADCTLYRMFNVAIQSNVISGVEQAGIYSGCTDGVNISGGRIYNVLGNAPSQAGVMTSYTTATNVANITLSNIAIPTYVATQIAAITVSGGGPGCLTTGNYAVLASPAPTSSSFSVACTGASGSGALTGTTNITPTIGGSGVFVSGDSKVNINSIDIDTTNVAGVNVSLVNGARADIGPGVHINGANQTVTGNPTQDSAIVIAPFVPGQSVSARVFGDSVTGGNSAYSVQMTGTAITGTSIAPTPQNDFGALRTSDNRNLKSPPPFINPENYLKQSTTWNVSPWTLSHGGVASNPVVTISGTLDPNGNPSQEVNFQLNGGSTTGDFSTVAQSQNFATQPNPHVASVGLWYKVNSGSTATFFLLDNVAHTGTNSILLTATTSWQFEALPVNATSTGDTYEIQSVGTLSSDAADLLISEAQLSYSYGTFTPTTNVAVDTTQNIYNPNAICVGPASSFTCATVLSSATPPVITFAGGDLACAHGGDTTALSTAITGGTATTLTVGTLPPIYKIPGTKVGVIGTTSSGGTLDTSGTSYYPVVSVSSNTITFASLGGTWTSGGTIFLGCQNTTDALVATPSYFAGNTYPVAAVTSGARYLLDFQMAYGSSVTASVPQLFLEYGSTLLFESSGETLAANIATSAQGATNWTVTAPTSALMLATKRSSLYSTSSGTSTSITTWPTTVSGAGPIKMGVGFGLNGLQSITSYTSGATVTGSIGQTCTLGTFNNGLTNAAVTATLTGNNTLTGATFVVTNTGYGATSTPTTATVSSGSATCSGTGTFVTVRGGAQGNWLLVQSLTASQ